MLDWPAVVEEMGDRLYSVALRITGNQQDAEDCVQQTFLSACRGLSHFRQDARLSTWLYKIVVNQSLAIGRRKTFSRLTYEQALLVRAPEGWEAATASREAVETALAQLPMDYRTAVVLRDVEGLSTAEAATVLGCNERALKSRLHRGRVLLRARLMG